MPTKLPVRQLLTITDYKQFSQKHSETTPNTNVVALPFFKGNKPVLLKPLSHRTATVLRQPATNIASGSQTVSKQSPVIRNFLACVAKWRKEVAKILKMFKNFMRQNSSQKGRKVIAGVSNPSRTCRRPLAI